MIKHTKAEMLEQPIEIGIDRGTKDMTGLTIRRGDRVYSYIGKEADVIIAAIEAATPEPANAQEIRKTCADGQPNAQEPEKPEIVMQGGNEPLTSCVTMECYEQICAERDALFEKTVSDEKDAARYRWLRENGYVAFLKHGDEADRIVDAEMAKPREVLIV